MKLRLRSYSHEIRLADGTTKVHTVDNPYPPFEENNNN